VTTHHFMQLNLLSVPSYTADKIISIISSSTANAAYLVPDTAERQEKAAIVQVKSSQLYQVDTLER
jgi:prephenate dehydratase